MALSILDLGLLDIMQGTFSLLFVLISLIVGLTILLKYREFKKKIYILVGLSWIGLANPWMPDSISFLMILFTLGPLPDLIYFIIGNAFLPIFLTIWIGAFTELLYKTKQKMAVTIFILIGLVFEVVFFTLLIFNPTEIGTISPSHPFTVNFGLFITLYLIGFIVILLITGILFARNSLKSSDLKVQLKGRFLLAAFLLFTIGAILDSSLGMIFQLDDPLLPLLVVLTRIILMLSALSFYTGFILPKWMNRLLIRE